MNRAETATGDNSLTTRTKTRVLSTELSADQAYIAQRYEDAYDRLVEVLWDAESELKIFSALEGVARYEKHEEILTAQAKVKHASNLVDLAIAHASRVYTHYIGSFDPLCSQDSDDDFKVTGKMHVGDIHRYREDPNAAMDDAETRFEVRQALRDERWYDDNDDAMPEPPRRVTDADLMEVVASDRAFEKLQRIAEEREARFQRALVATEEEMQAELLLLLGGANVQDFR